MISEKKSKCFVVDASVARAAGGIEATKPVPTNCRDFLIKTYLICHKVIVTDDINKEWGKHKSRFFTKWLADMKGRKKYVRFTVSTDDRIRGKIESSTAISESQRKAMMKDMRLVEAAMASDNIIISTDKSARKLFAKLSRDEKSLKNICWINPADLKEEQIAWLESGASFKKEYSLGHT